jgi:hypothetical protein
MKNVIFIIAVFAFTRLIYQGTFEYETNPFGAK